eukprot:9211865-Lingulodinium_polyedra.AAC.1
MEPTPGQVVAVCPICHYKSLHWEKLLTREKVFTYILGGCFSWQLGRGSALAGPGPGCRTLCALYP